MCTRMRQAGNPLSTVEIYIEQRPLLQQLRIEEMKDSDRCAVVEQLFSGMQQAWHKH